MRLWKSLVLGVCFVLTLMGCQALAKDDPSKEVKKASEEESEKVKVFSPYQEQTVPQLVELVSREGFLAYADKKPYLLGYSYDGVYLASIVHAKEEEAYRLDIHHTGLNKVIASIYIPSYTSLQYEEGHQEQIEAAQQMIDMGFRIKVPVQPQWIKMNQSIPLVTAPGGGEELTVERDERYFALWMDEVSSDERRKLHEWSVGGEAVVGEEALLTSYTAQKEKWTILVPLWSETGGIKLHTYTFDLKTVRTVHSEKKLQEQIDLQMQRKGKVIYRGPLRAESKHYSSLIAVAEELEQGQETKMIAYQGEVREVILLGAEGKVLFKGKRNRIGSEENEVEPTYDWETSYYVSLIRTEDSGPVEQLVIDRLNGKGDVVKTYEWYWDTDKMEFKQKN
ncbi:hypothetical protein NXZ84_00820 [Mechercharimyces sp. CAU 1602]|nr:hypothetical protein [Mechercharimyces sp. CAU 1602]